MKVTFLLFVVGLSLSTATFAGRGHGRPKDVDADEEVPKNALYVGCRPSRGECQSSCAERNGIGIIQKSKCNPESFLDRDRYACYCPIGRQ